MAGDARLQGVSVLEAAIAECNHNEDTNRCLSIIQSSGFGKSKACVDLSRKQRTVYFPCGTSGDVQLPAIVLDIVSILVGAGPLSRMKIARKVIISIVKAAELYTTAKSLHEAQFSSSCTYFSKLEEIWHSVSKEVTPEKIKVRFADDPDLYTQIIREEVTDRDLIIVFDEAVFLSPIEAPTELLGPLRCLIRLINATKLIGVFLSTSSTCAHVHPGHLGSRQASLADYPPIINICFVDLYKGHRFFLGRPLWYQKYKDFGSSFCYLVSFVRGLLLQPHSKSRNSDLVHCALFFCRFLNGAILADVDYFVGHHLATLSYFQVNEKREFLLRATYNSEPIIAETSAFITSLSGQYSPETVLSCVCSVIHKGTVVEQSLGDRGELSIAAGLMYTMDALRFNKIGERNYDPDKDDQSFSSDIPCLEFLDAISGVVSGHRDTLEGYVVNFTHFMRVLEFSERQTMLAYDRGAAIALQTGAEAVDLVVVMNNPTKNTYGLILIQVKNYKDFISEHDAYDLLLKCCSFPDLAGYIDDFDSNAIVAVVAAAGGVSAAEQAIATINKVIQFPLRKTRRTEIQDERLILTSSICNFILLSSESQEILWRISSRFQKPSKRDGDLMKFIREYGSSGYSSYMKFHPPDVESTDRTTSE